MPQFDSSSFLSQVFWLIICFAVLYLAMSKIYLPKISSIILERKKQIEQNCLLASELNSKINHINLAVEESKKNSFKQYQIATEQAVKQAALYREEALNDLKRKTDIATSNSQKHIEEFVENSKKNSQAVIVNLVHSLHKTVYHGASDSNL